MRKLSISTGTVDGGSTGTAALVNSNRPSTGNRPDDAALDFWNSASWDGVDETMSFDDGTRH
jgi:hypothetical protein